MGRPSRLGDKLAREPGSEGTNWIELTSGIVVSGRQNRTRLLRVEVGPNDGRGGAQGGRESVKACADGSSVEILLRAVGVGNLGSEIEDERLLSSALKDI